MSTQTVRQTLSSFGSLFSPISLISLEPFSECCYNEVSGSNGINEPNDISENNGTNGNNELNGCYCGKDAAPSLRVRTEPRGAL
jgi:hypothetical protein